MREFTRCRNHRVACRVRRDIRKAGRFGDKRANHSVRLHVAMISREHQEIVERDTASLSGNFTDGLLGAVNASFIADIGKIVDPGFLECFRE